MFKTNKKEKKSKLKIKFKLINFLEKIFLMERMEFFLGSSVGKVVETSKMVVKENYMFTEFKAMFSINNSEHTSGATRH